MKNQNWYPHLSEQVTMLPLGIMTARSHSVGNLATVNFTGTGHWNQLVYYCKIKYALKRILWRWCWADWKSQKETAQWSILTQQSTSLMVRTIQRWNHTLVSFSAAFWMRDLYTRHIKTDRRKEQLNPNQRTNPKVVSLNPHVSRVTFSVTSS